MPITSLTTFKIDREQGLRLAAQAAPILKRHGATAVRAGFCHAGPRTGTVTVVTIYPDWQVYGRAVQGMYEDQAYQALFAEVMKVGELLDRSIMVMQDL
jgi:hypothetical protein